MSEDQSASSPSFLRRWFGLCLLNLLIVSIFGVLLRYKGAFYMPFFNYQYLLNAHSHFAFSGWVTTALFTGLVYILHRSGMRIAPSYRWMFRLNQVSSFGMLVSFTWEGYAAVSIFFSTLSILFSYWFTFRYWRDLRSVAAPRPVIVCIRLALLFLVLSSSGPYLLGYSMSHGIGNRAFYYNAIYLYLHFQYNGWFSFAVLALFFWTASAHGWGFPRRAASWFVGLMGMACIPAYCLSLLWTEPPTWVWLTAFLAASAQVAALIILVRTIWKGRSGWRAMPRWTQTVWSLSLIAFSIKIVLQLFSVIPSIGHLAFGFRPVIIAYLHLVLLGFISLFLLGFFFYSDLRGAIPSLQTAGLSVFIAGILANEVILLLQCLMAFAGQSWMTCPYYLLAAAIILLAGAATLLSAALRATASYLPMRPIAPM